MEDITRVFGLGTEFYLPAHTELVRTREMSYALFDGYVFVNICNIEDIRSPVSHLPTGVIGRPLKNGKIIEILHDAEIERYRMLAEERAYTFIPKVNQQVLARTGTFAGLEGVVRAVDKKNRLAEVSFKMMSRSVSARVKFINLTEHSKHLEDRREVARASRGTLEYRLDI